MAHLAGSHDARFEASVHGWCTCGGAFASYIGLRSSNLTLCSSSAPFSTCSKPSNCHIEWLDVKARSVAHSHSRQNTSEDHHLTRLAKSRSRSCHSHLCSMIVKRTGISISSSVPEVWQDGDGVRQAAQVGILANVGLPCLDHRLTSINKGLRLALLARLHCARDSCSFTSEMLQKNYLMTKATGEDAAPHIGISKAHWTGTRLTVTLYRTREREG